jgi:hypothetical protein
MGVELAAEDVNDVSVVLTQAQPPEASQPAIPPPPIEKLDLATVRAATIRAAEQGLDPFEMTVGDLKQGQAAVPQKTAQAETPADVPEKFKKPNGEVDVEKLKTSTERLDEATQKKEQAIQKSIDDYVKAYREKEAKFKNLPNPEKLQANLQAPPPPVVPAPVPLDPATIRARIEQDFERDKIGTLSDLVDIIVNQKMGQQIAPLREDLEQVRVDRQDRQLRENLQDLAQKDPRILNPKVFAAITAKLDAEPDLWKLKNPHKAAWLDIKDELRLGDVPNGASAQPSRPPSPILGGGTPPPTPSSSDSGPLSVDTLLQAASRLGRDPRDVKYDPKQAANMRVAAKELFDKLDRQARR